MIYGYARVSTKGQERDGNSLECQVELLREKGATEIYSESFTGTALHRPKLDELLSKLTDGDTIVVAKLDRIARNTQNGISIIQTIIDKGCALWVLNMGLFDNTPTGRLMVNVLLAFAEFERDMIVQRTSEGKAKARENPDFREGRPKRTDIDLELLDKLQSAYSKGEITIKNACKELGVGVGTWYSLTKQM